MEQSDSATAASKGATVDDGAAASAEGAKDKPERRAGSRERDRPRKRRSRSRDPAPRHNTRRGRSRERYRSRSRDRGPRRDHHRRDDRGYHGGDRRGGGGRRYRSRSRSARRYDRPRRSRSPPPRQRQRRHSRSRSRSPGASGRRPHRRQGRRRSSSSGSSGSSSSSSASRSRSRSNSAERGARAQKTASGADSAAGDATQTADKPAKKKSRFSGLPAAAPGLVPGMGAGTQTAAAALMNPAAMAAAMGNAMMAQQGLLAQQQGLVGMMGVQGLQALMATGQLQQQQQALAAAQAVTLGSAVPNAICNPATKTSRELHLGNTPPGIPEIELKTLLNEALTQAGLVTPDLPGGNAPIVQVRVSAKFAFAEFRTVEEATMGMNLNGIVVNHYPLNVQRPRLYNGPPSMSTTWQSFMAEKVTTNPELEGHVLGLTGESDGTGGSAADPIASVVGNPATKAARELFIGNMPEGVAEATLFEFLSTAMLGANLLKPDLPRATPLLQVRLAGKFAFAEFRSVEECTMATQLNGLVMGGMPLNIQRPRAYVDPGGAAGSSMNAAAVAPAVTNTLPASATAAPAAGGSGSAPRATAAAGAVEADAASSTATAVLQLSNMVTTEELSDPEAVKEIIEDVTEECEKFGQVKHVEIPTPDEAAAAAADAAGGDGGAAASGLGLVFVQFGTAEQASSARKVLSGRTFSSAIVGAHFYPEADFEARKLRDITATTV